MGRRMAVDRPLPALIRFPLPDGGKDSGDLFYLSSGLAQAGFIFWEPREWRRVVGRRREVELICTFVDSRALRDWKKSASARAFFKSHQVEPLVCTTQDLLLDGDDVQTCACKSHEFLYLARQPFAVESALICGHCRGRLPAYALKAEWGVGSWDHAQRRVTDLWMRSDLYESWAERQLRELSSDLNARGRDVARRVSAAKGIPVLYVLYEEIDGPRMKCPGCRRAPIATGWPFPAKKCDSCLLAW